ncbi:hypothetical protein [Dokdonia sp.]|uniref:hypothetical protein n=1 Tax=Dokdonia sp. TaxID=2024995 RepID=UPI003267DAA8
MEDLHHIEDSKLPLELDYKALKEEGMAYIQKHSGNQWTNLNPSDPGITILNQLCYAFTELGYCANFPIKDILTNSDGVLETENQFFSPEDILTTSPITTTDYVKYIVDRVAHVKNCYIDIFENITGAIQRQYQIYLLIDAKITDPKKIDAICQEVFFVVNKVRNLGEYFLNPLPLNPIDFLVSGTLEIAQGYNMNSILTEINYSINNFIFPEIVQTGYDTLQEEGVSINNIFNGPKLKNGWVDNSTIGFKKNVIEAYEIQKEIRSIKGVISITGVRFTPSQHIKNTTQDPYCISSKPNEVLTLNFIESIEVTKSFTIVRKGRALNKTINQDFINEIATLKLPSSQIERVASIQMNSEYPKGKYRDISNYYSIQNTFPEIYAVGIDALEANATNFQIAQSRQLKGYLTLFDQVLSNQFAQLANLGTLFSFKNPMTGAPTEEKHFNETRNEFDLENPKYPASFKSFSATYFYQSLYNSVPYIRPLLKNNDTYKYSFGNKPAKILENDSWLAYMQDPYNAYIHGLMVFIEDEQVNLDRRNKILDHLLARHGESPFIIDRIISIHAYSAMPLKTQVIIKSLLLQNYQSLSYYRTKAYDYLGASKLYDTIKPVTDSYIEKLLEGNQSDFIFNTEAVDKEQFIQPVDFQNHATAVLKLNLLFAIDSYYHNFLIQEKNSKDDKGIALWLLDNRKGLFFIETDLLKQSLKYDFVIRETRSDNEAVFVTLDRKLDYKQILKLDQILKHVKGQDLNTIKNEIIQVIKETLKFSESTKTTINSDSFQAVKDTPYAWAVVFPIDNDKEEDTSISLYDPLFNDTVVLLFPKFILGTENSTNEDNDKEKESHFEEKLDYFLENELPIQVTPKKKFLQLSEIAKIIPLYVAWHNSLIYDTGDNKKTDPSKTTTPPLTESIKEFATIIIKLITSR